MAGAPGVDHSGSTTKVYDEAGYLVATVNFSDVLGDKQDHHLGRNHHLGQNHHLRLRQGAGRDALWMKEPNRAPAAPTMQASSR